MVYVYLKELPGYCHEMVSQNKDGTYTVIVNSLLARDQQLEAYHHALRHILGNHFELDAQSAEREAHKKGTAGTVPRFYKEPERSRS